MALRYYANAPATTLAASLTAGATSASVNSVTGLPSQFPYTLILDRGTATEEVVEVTAASGTTLTLTRGVDSTTAFAHSLGATVEHGISARDIREANTHVNATGSVHGLTGSVVGTSDTQSLTNKNLTSGTNTFPSTLATTNTSQALTNKDLTGAGNVFPTSLVTLSGTQTLTNKTLTSPTISGIGNRRLVRKAADQTNNTTTMALDNDLKFTVEVGAVYRFRGVLLVYTSYTPYPVKFGWNVGTTTFSLGGITTFLPFPYPVFNAYNGSGTYGQNWLVNQTTNTPYFYQSQQSGYGDPILIEGFVDGITAAGTINLTFANSSSASYTTQMKIGSYLQVERVA